MKAHGNMDPALRRLLKKSQKIDFRERLLELETQRAPVPSGWFRAGNPTQFRRRPGGK